jgi:hypothetical protein
MVGIVDGDSASFVDCDSSISCGRLSVLYSVDRVVASGEPLPHSGCEPLRRRLWWLCRRYIVPGERLEIAKFTTCDASAEQFGTWQVIVRRITASPIICPGRTIAPITEPKTMPFHGKRLLLVEYRQVVEAARWTLSERGRLCLGGGADVVVGNGKNRRLVSQFQTRMLATRPV